MEGIVRSEEPALRLSIAAVWLATGVMVLHPHYREIGEAWLARIPLPPAVMWLACLGEILLGAWLLRGPMTPVVAGLQVVLVTGFTLILAALDPWLLAHPFGVLTKNLPLLAVVGTAWLLHREGWSPRATGLLRVGMALIWLTEGLVPKILFQQPAELAVVANSGWVSMDPGRFLIGLGAAQALSGIAVLVLRGRALQLLLGAQVLALVVLPVLVSVQDPLLWVHPFGPLTKNLPILVGTAVVLMRCRTSS